MNDLETKLSELYEKIPALSPSGKQTAAKIIPWLTLGLGIFGLLSWVGTLQAFFAFSGLAQAVLPNGIWLLAWAAAPVIQLLAVYGGYLMLKRRRFGWRLGFYSLLIGALMNIISFTPTGLLMNLVFLYFFFQVREFFPEQENTRSSSDVIK